MSTQESTEAERELARGTLVVEQDIAEFIPRMNDPHVTRMHAEGYSVRREIIEWVIDQMPPPTVVDMKGEGKRIPWAKRDSGRGDLRWSMREGGFGPEAFTLRDELVASTGRADRPALMLIEISPVARVSVDWENTETWTGVVVDFGWADKPNVCARVAYSAEDYADLVADEPKPAIIYRCFRCGGPSVEGTAWVDLNKNSVVIGEEPPTSETWCRDCCGEVDHRGVCRTSAGDDVCLEHPGVDCKKRWESKE